MGLLEDAIRDHLELQRRQGVDPEVIAETERQALSPVVADEPATWGMDHDSGAEAFADEHYEAPRASAPPAQPSLPPVLAPDSLEARAVDMSVVSQETAELDMRELLGYDVDEQISATEAHPLAPVRAGRLRQRITQSDSDWAAGEQIFGGHPPEAIPGQESLTFE